MCLFLAPACLGLGKLLLAWLTGNMPGRTWPHSRLLPGTPGRHPGKDGRVFHEALGCASSQSELEPQATTASEGPGIASTYRAPREAR